MIGIINYGLGNIKAFSNIYKRLGIPHTYVSSVAELSQVQKIILPGVGSFDYAMKRLNDSGLREALDDLVLSKEIPVLGICVGMQMMARSSDEGIEAGLGWIPGVVKKFNFDSMERSQLLPLPHMGWNDVKILSQDAIFSGFAKEAPFYFLHSYYFQDDFSDVTVASTNYGYDFSCIVKKKNIYGIQCHPEKSHQSGVLFLKNFASL